MIEIFVATHKKINIALPSYCIPIQVNAEKNGKWEGYRHDNDSQDNISLKNNSYCELTALYEMWKNCNADIQGLFHYRRFLTGRDEVSIRNENLVGYVGKRSGAWAAKHIITENEMEMFLEKSDVIVPMLSMPFPFTVYEDLQRFVYEDDIQKMVKTVETLYPEYSDALHETLNGTRISYCNMFIARKNFVNEYCTWLFEILKAIEPYIKLDSYDTNHQRIFGYYAEVLMNVYIRRNSLKTKEVYMVETTGRQGLSAFKLRMRQIGNSFLSFFGIYPLYSKTDITGRELCRIRYEQMRNGEVLPKLRNVEETVKWMKKHGFTEIVTENETVKGRAGSMWLVVGRNQEKANPKLHDKFGFATVYRQFSED